VFAANGREALVKARALNAELRRQNQGYAWTMVTQATKPLEVRVLPRGNFLDQTGPVVLPSTPSFLPGLRTSTEQQRLTRLDLADWITSKDNPITARTFMNRLWQTFYGTGLTAVLDDLGSQGELPSHPELLEWLALEFRDKGWDVKRMIRLMVTSRTYRQSSSLRPELKEIDPANRLLASQNPRRLDAEFIRDNALAVAGLLHATDIGGPSSKPYQPAGYYEPIQFPNRNYVASNGPDQWRRGLYMHWQRMFLHPMLVNFDAPARDECTALRSYSNTPQQALTLLNDPVFVEAARAFAARLLARPADERLTHAFRLAVGREVKADERPSLEKLVADQKAYYASHPRRRGEVAEDRPESGARRRRPGRTRRLDPGLPRPPQFPRSDHPLLSPCALTTPSPTPCRSTDGASSRKAPMASVARPSPCSPRSPASPTCTVRSSPVALSRLRTFR
jgi:hypothetical protein